MDQVALVTVLYCNRLIQQKFGWGIQLTALHSSLMRMENFIISHFSILEVEGVSLPEAQSAPCPSVSVDTRSRPNFKSVISHRKGTTHSIKVSKLCSTSTVIGWGWFYSTGCESRNDEEWKEFDPICTMYVDLTAETASLSQWLLGSSGGKTIPLL